MKQEELRLEIQSQLDAAKTQQERNRLGQFATPTALAAEMLQYGLSLLDSSSVRFLDPAIGTGSFYSALLRAVPTSCIATATGFEIDPHYGEPARQLWSDTPLQLHLGDFTRATPPDAGYERATLLISNPPYVRHHHLTSADSLRGATKWTRFSRAGNAYGNGEAGGLVFSDLFRIQRGVATGANEFFLMTPEQATEHQIPAEFLKPILPSPRFLSSDGIPSADDGSPLIERPLFLLSCNLPESQIERRYPSLWKYLQRGVELGIDRRYLSTHRTPWYAQEGRLPAPFRCTYMGRIANGRAFRFILNHADTIAANVYLMLYPRPILQRRLVDVEVRRSVWVALNAITPEQIIGEGRVYGGGLHKIEPRELGNAPADAIIAAVPDLHIPTSEQTTLFPV